ncbi:xanthine dehydrogenase family protein molybdopterin-binding subunit [Bradyrhizobium sp. WSM3983]|uniref:xanthine dehydrogenase family protein molybdopterin-binding subunit n=1 Tax=Bradyrhizobium sp. WSM3983 TaxID=1038867 RepID=UPI00042864E9|nr:xanthine dehydrogenase family protein molybdopterin-binding subunit [Bradyrhizobium sp. WSM3983]
MSTSVFGQSIPRVDGPLKVSGGARYAFEFNQSGQLYAVIVNATIGIGRIVSIEATGVEQMPGVRAVISHLNAPKLTYSPHKGVIDPAVGERLRVFQDEQIRFFGQPVAVIVADTLDQAEHAATALRLRYDAQAPLTEIDDPRAQPIVAQQTAAANARVAADRERGSADQAFADTDVKVDAIFRMARENHSPMEPHATVASWEGDSLTVWSKSQYVLNERAELAAIFGIPPENVLVICPFVGGAFGTSLRTWSHVGIAALAARVVGRPVKLALTRKQMFLDTGHRPRTDQRIAIAATNQGKLTAIIHEATAETSRYEEFIEGITNQTEFLYSCPNVRTRYRLVPTDTSTPTYMRAPGECTGMHALECGLDELAAALDLDPIELRRRNEPTVDESNGRPFSSRSLLQCLETGAERFGWSQRNPRPGSMRDGRWQIGWGVAGSTRGAPQAPADASVRLLPDGRVEVASATSDMGPGTYTSMAQVAAATLGVPVERIKFELGRSDMPTAPSHGGSWTMASVGNAVRSACLAAQDAAVRRAVEDPASIFHGLTADVLHWKDGTLGRKNGEGPRLDQVALLRGGMPIDVRTTASRSTDIANRYSMYGYAAFFTEVAVDADLGIVRIRRMLGVYGIGKVVNPRLARSQCIGGMVGGIGMALMERTVLDQRDGRPVNAHMADYLVPVNLDVPTLETQFLDEQDDAVNPLGIKGIGELCIIGVAPAIANAVYHATGKRVRELPIRIENLLGA